MRNATAGVIVSVMVLSGAATAVQAQTVFVGGGWTGGWDDETNLGQEWSRPAGSRTRLAGICRVEGEVSWARHLRDSGYLAADGTPLIGTARLAYLFQGPGSRARAFASAGLGIVHSTGHFTTRTIVRGPGGLPVEGPSTRSDWSLTKPAFELGGGVSIKVGRQAVVSARGALDVDEPRRIPGHARLSSRRCGSSAPASRWNGACGADLSTYVERRARRVRRVPIRRQHSRSVTNPTVTKTGPRARRA